MEFIDLKQQQARIRDQIDARIARVLEHGKYIMGPEIQELEEKLAAYVGSKNCITCSSGTDALLLPMMALGIGSGDEVITTPFTFIATGEMIALLGAKPVFVDIDPVTYNIDPALIEGAITERTKAIVPVNLYGQCANMEAINEIASKYDLPVFEDGAQSLGATTNGRQSCSLSTAGATSFFPSKPLGGYGDGGAVFTDDEELATKMKQIRIHGQDRRYHHPLIGLNARMDTLQAAIVLVKLEIFDEEVQLRGQIGARYTELLKDSVTTPTLSPGNTSVYAQYTIQVEEREKVLGLLKESGVPTAVHYPVPLNLQPAFSHLGQGPGSFPLSEAAANRVMSLPMHPYLSRDDQDQVVESVKKAVAQTRATV